MLTELDVINDMLSAVGMTPVTAADDRHPSYNKAKKKFSLTSNKLQSIGFWFNTTYPTLRRDTNNFLYIPDDTLHCDPVDNRINTAKRGRRLFNMDARSFAFSADIKVKLVQELVFDDLPETAKQYLLDNARYAYYLDEDGVEPKLSNLRNDKLMSWSALYREHLRNRDTNYFSGPNFANTMSRGYRRNRLPGPQE